MKCFITLLMLLMGIFSMTHAQRKWTGAIDSSWSNPLNWAPTGIPAISDDVLLDNSVLVTNYTVMLPASAVTVVSLLINPAAEKSIRLILPIINISSPALVLTSMADALILNRGAVFMNASGLNSGQSLKISGSIRINNGGLYIHNTRSAHANDIVAKLSVAEGTEEGVFEFDIPVASSTISLSNRSFGKLKLSSVSYNGTVSYSGGGSNPVTIRSDLEIGEKVNFSIGFANVFTIRRNLIQYGGNFNISNDNNATILAIGGHLLQWAGQMTETGGATPVLLLNGALKQDLQFSSSLLNEIIVRMDNPAGAELKSPLSINYRLELKQGKIKTTPATLLTLLNKAAVAADSLSTSFIDGPLRKEGLNLTSHFLFPVGKFNRQRWVELKNATGNFVVTYKQQNPYDFSTVMDQGLHHVSSLETWTIDADAAPIAEAAVELSFDNMHSGGVSDLNALRVAAWVPGIKWSNRGNKMTTGAAGASGSVISELVTNFSSENRLFTLGSSASNQNTLPEKTISFSGKRKGDMILFQWQIGDDLPVKNFVIESAGDAIHFTAIKTIPAQTGHGIFNYTHREHQAKNFYRIKVDLKDETSFYSNVLRVEGARHNLSIVAIAQLRNELNITVHSLINEKLLFQMHDITGRLILRKNESVTMGDNRLVFRLPATGKGIYYVTIISGSSRQVRKFLKS